MNKLTLGSAAAAAFFLAFSGAASSAPFGADTAPAGTSGVTLAHGFHYGCQLGKRGWHRHNQFGERRLCRKWQGGGKRPDYCIRVGGFWYCDY